MTTGGLYQYRAIAECSACGKVVDVGPFGSLQEAIDDQGTLGGWLGPHQSVGWVIHPAASEMWRVTLCDECMNRPVVDVLRQITERSIAGKVK